MRKFYSICFSVVLLSVLASSCSDPRMTSLADQVWMVKIVVDPFKSRYEIGDQVNLDYIVLDWFGNTIEGIGATWEKPDPQQVLQLGEKDYQFTTVGAFTWRVTLEPPYGHSDVVSLRVPAVPTQVEIVVDPALDYYVPGDQVQMDYLVFDQLGDQMTGIGATWQNPPPSLARDEGGDLFTLIAEGLATWTVTLEDPYDLSDTETLVIDASGPSLDIGVPERGDTIRRLAGTDEITVRGQIADAYAGVDVVTIRTNMIDSTPAEVLADGSFSLVTPAKQGLNIVEIMASDLAGNETLASRAYHYSTDFFAYQDDTQGRSELEDLTSVWFGEMALDRGRPTGNPPYDPCAYDNDDRYVCSEIRDLASLLELALNNMDFAESQPGQDFNYPIVDEAWQFDLTDDIEVRAALEGDFDLEFGFEHIKAGLTKVDVLESYTSGIHAGLSFNSYKDSNGEDQPGLNVAYGMTATLTFNIWLDLTATDPFVQAGLCILADSLCNPDPPYDCLSEYLLACPPAGQATPIAQSVSYIDVDELAGLSIDQMLSDLDLDIGLDAGYEPEVSLADLEVDMGQGVLDVSALEDVEVSIGTIRFASFEIDLGTWQFPTTFISDLASQILEPLVNGLKPIIEFALNEFFTCTDPQNPVCFVMPFLQDLFAEFAVDKDVEIANPFDTTPGAEALATAHVLTRHGFLGFETARGGDMRLSARIDSQRAEALDEHSDDDILGIALVDGCLAEPEDFNPPDAGEKSLQVASSLDLINMGLFAIWQAGGFDLELDESHFDLPAELSVASLSLSLRPWLPPIMTACGAEGQTLVYGLGDLRLTGELETQDGRTMTFDGFASLLVGGEVAANASADGLEARLDDEPGFATAEIVGATVDGQPADLASRETLAAMLKEQLAGQLLGPLADIGLNLVHGLFPVYDISLFLGQDPETSWWTIGDIDAHQEQDHTVANGDLTD